MNYLLNHDDKYMCQNHLEFFKSMLLAQKDEYIQNMRGSVCEVKNIDHLTENSDKSIRETDLGIISHNVSYKNFKLREIDAALMRIQDKDYGYCCTTGLPIGLMRLEIDPTARYCVEMQASIGASKNIHLN